MSAASPFRIRCEEDAAMVLSAMLRCGIQCHAHQLVVAIDRGLTIAELAVHVPGLATHSEEVSQMAERRKGSQ